MIPQASCTLSSNYKHNSRQTLKHSDKTNKYKHINLREIAFKMIQLLLNMNIVVTTITLYYIKSHKVGGLSHANVAVAMMNFFLI